MNGVSFKSGFTVQPIFVSQKLEQVVKSKKVQPPINQQCMVNSLSCWLKCPTSSPMHVHMQELSDWRTTFGGPWELMLWMKIKFGSFAIDVQSLSALCTRGCLKKNAIHVSAQWPIPSLWPSLFKNIFTHLFASAVNHLCFQSTVFYRSIS